VRVQDGQGDLFAPPTAPWSRLGTSQMAAADIEEHLNRLEEEVLLAVLLLGGATCDEVEVVLEMRHQTASARLNQLEHREYVMDSGVRRATRSGRMAMVYRLTTIGRAVAVELGKRRREAAER
jgi:predicted ArsR family transcriptional regulator